MLARGLVPSSRLLAATEVPATAEVALALELPEGTPVYCIERLRLADNLPMCLETVHLPARLFPHLLASDLSGSLYELLNIRFRTTVTRAEQTFSAAKLTKRQSDLLGVPAGSAALVMRHVGADAR